MILAIDIGGTFFRYKFGDVFEIKKTKNIDIIDEILKLIKTFKPERLGISFAGQVFDGKILSSPNIKVKEIDLKKLIKIPFILENDLNCAAVAESRYYNCDFLVALYSGTGLGAGIVENGKLLRGYMNLAGEIGHIPYKETPFVCGCGKNDCLEFFASSKVEKVGTFEDYKEALSKAVGTVAALFNPQIIVLGGGYYLHHRFEIDQKYIPNFDKLKIKVTKLKDASLSGAEILVKEEL
ncbi:glucokinase [Lebetimonas natsushimae]|uniref:Glucokinase n=1 Tax=Lebetimonas natsushimae TaxID=1936991 RepID=A0A292YCL7_9BACT|nr:ROK family protein [Lebetimonas natsushimae]GAX87458.1 glucokinase [Lebetimonas natsushimae]